MPKLNKIPVMKSFLPFLALAALSMGAGPLFGQNINPYFVYKGPESLSTLPDLDGDGNADIVVVERATGIVRGGIAGGGIAWLEPVHSGISNTTGLASGPLEVSTKDSIALVSPLANRVNLFSVSGGGWNAAPRTVFNDIFGLRDLAALEEGSIGTPATVELIGFSPLADPSSPGLRDSLTWNGSTLESYGAGWPDPDFEERDYQRLIAEPGVDMFGFFVEDVDPGFDGFVLVYIFDGSFDVLAEVLVEDGARLVQASFDQSGAFQFLFHVPGSSELDAYFWDGGTIQFIDRFALDGPALALYPYVDGNFTGFLAMSPDQTAYTVYGFNGFDPPASVSTLTPAQGSVVGPALSFPGGGMVLLSGSDSANPTEFAELLEHDGSGFVSQGDLGIPSVTTLSLGSNVLLFSGTPFIEENAPLTGKLGSRVWTSAIGIGPGVEVLSEIYTDEQGGLQDPQSEDLGAPPAGTTDGLVNQVAADISLYDEDAPLGLLPGAVIISPDPGVYEETVTVAFATSPPGMDVIYRILPDGSWDSTTSTIPPMFSSFELQYFGIDGSGNRTPIRIAAYEIPVDPAELDSDEDTVPDFVELQAGLDPVLSGDDGDGDGYSDLVELMAGTDPADPASVPPSRELDSDGDGFSDLEEAVAGTGINDAGDFPASEGVLNLQNVFDLIGVPYGHDGASNAQVPVLPESVEVPGGDPLATDVRLYSPGASLLRFDRTDNLAVSGVTDPAALLSEVSLEDSEQFLVVSTGRNFNLNVAAPDTLLGRQIAALVPFPDVSLDPVSFAYGGAGGNPSAEATAWLNAAKAHYAAIQRPSFVEEFDLFDTLSLLLVELKLEQILQYRGLLTLDQLTLTGFRGNETPVSIADAPGDGSESVVVPFSVLESLRHKFDGTDTGYLPKIILETIGQSVQTAPTQAICDLRNVAGEIYRISAATANDNPGTLLPPLDALRQFIRTGSLLNTGYLPDPVGAPFDATTLASAYAAVGSILSEEMRRPLDFRELEVEANSEQAGCTVLRDVTTLETVSLIDFQGNPYPLPDSFSLPVGTRLTVEGYADKFSDCGADVTLEVIPPAQLVLLPVVAANDANGNLISDDLEDLYPQPLDPFGDSDGDGFSDLQETLEGTNPFNGSDVPANSPVSLVPPEVAIGESSPTTFTLSFEYPGTYAGDINFRLFSGLTPQSMTTDTGLDASHTGGDAFQLILNKPGSLPIFYRFQMQLK